MLAIFLTPIATIAFALVVIVPISLYYSWATSYLWGWFIVPAFGAPALSTLQIWGITLTLGLLQPRMNLEKSREKDFEGALIALIAAPIVALGLGYSIRFWWM
jgi:hypothetical protein